MAQKLLKVSQDDLERIIEMAVKKYVNGKIDRIAAHLVEQDIKIDELKPLLQGYNNTKITSRIVTRVVAWAFGLLISIGSAYLLINQILTTLHA